MSQNRGFSLIELMIVIAIMLIIAVIAIPNLVKAKMHAHEMAAIKTIQTIQAAQIQYQTQYGRFAASLAELGPPQSGESGPQAADLIDSGLAAGEAGLQVLCRGQPVRLHRQRRPGSVQHNRYPDFLFGPDDAHPPESRPGARHRAKSAGPPLRVFRVNDSCSRSVIE